MDYEEPTVDTLLPLLDKDSGESQINKILNILAFENPSTGRKEIVLEAVAKSTGKSKSTIKIIYREKERLAKNTFEKRRKEQLEKNKIPSVIPQQLMKEDLLNLCLQELDETHIGDTKEKIATFILTATSELPNPRDHQSVALKGDSSEGKDNMADTILMHFPKEETFRLTRATESALEDETQTVKRIHFSEINKGRDEGANKYIVEVVKALAEGGLRVKKKDLAKQNRVTKSIEVSQKTVLFGTTETETDEELETRFVTIPVRGNEQKNRKVVNSILDEAGNKNKIIARSKYEESWIVQCIRALKPVHVVIPFSSALKIQINLEDEKQYLFDCTKPRIKRDVKRLLSCVKAITYLYQFQRRIEIEKNHIIAYAEPCDLYVALEIFQPFFNLTYRGLDHRTDNVLEKINELVGKHDDEILSAGFGNFVGWAFRHHVQKACNIQSPNTIKKHINILKDLGYIETHYDPDKQKYYLVRPINQPVSNLSVTCQAKTVDGLLMGKIRGNDGLDEEEQKEQKKIVLSLTDDREQKSEFYFGFSGTKLTGQALTGQFNPPIAKEKTDSDSIPDGKVDIKEEFI